MKKDILNLSDLKEEDFNIFFKTAKKLKKERYKIFEPLKNKAIGLIFEKASTRTRVSFESAVIELGGTPVFLNPKDMQVSRNEPIQDTARVLTKYIDGLVMRTFSQKLIEKFAKYSEIPVINALSDMYHPCQILSDIMTIIEHKKNYKNLKIAWLGDGNNVANSWINAAEVLNLNFYLACPKDYSPEIPSKKTKNIVLTDDPISAVKDADVIYTDVWASMGQEKEQKKRVEIFFPYQLNEKLLRYAKKDAIVMHCLPAHRGEEITEDVLEGKNSIVWNQAGNKLHMHKAILTTLIKN